MSWFRLIIGREKVPSGRQKKKKESENELRRWTALKGNSS